MVARLDGVQEVASSNLVVPTILCKVDIFLTNGVKRNVGEGAVAQLGEHYNGIVGVAGSSPVSSTNSPEFHSQKFTTMQKRTPFPASGRETIWGCFFIYKEGVKPIYEF